ncbi:hypothetical protein [uncultured Paraglaciecola sp.]|uniref:hypothetical protein n=1 Tax=uncultured Paraglaciecola sp. TaxID=1765024 RepID=UPI002606A3D0|nr:hypothetical protein [uncultured Paraglaciecola sp.]
MADTYQDYYIADDTLTDHSDSSTEGTIAWAVAQINAETTAEGRRRKIIVGSGEYDFTNLVRIEDNITIEGSGTGATLLNFNSTSGGFVFGNGEMHTGGETVAVGEYRLPHHAPTTEWPFELRMRCTGTGTTGTIGQFASDCAGATTAGNTFTATGGTATFEAVAFCTPEFKGFAYNMASGMTGSGILINNCNGVRFRDLVATGGNAAGWALELAEVNQFSAESLLFEVDSSGILVNFRNADVFPYNYGDGVFQGVDVTLGSANTVGVKFLGHDTTNDTINNILFDRLEVIKSGANVTDCCVGVWLEQAKRNTFLHLDVEGCNVGIMEIGRGGERSQANTFIQYQFQPSAGDQAAEGYPYARGVPLQAAATTPFLTAKVRENWLNYSPFSDWPGGTSTAYIADDDGTWGRDVTAVSTAVGGIIDMTMSGTIPTSGRTDLSRYPVIAPTANHANATRIMYAEGIDGVDSLGSSGFALGSDSDHNWFTVIFKRLATYTMAIRSIRGNATGLKIDVYESNANSSPTLSPEAAADQVYIERLVPGGELTAEPGTTAAGMVVRADGSTWNPGSGAGTYIRNAADTAWVFIG